jgi:hypothetical protein
MDRTRARRFVVLLSAAWLAGVAAPAAAERIASKAEAPAESRAADLARVRDAVARDQVAQALAAHGLTAREVEERLVRLSADDLRRLAVNLDQVQAAGQVPNYIWILLGILLAVTIVAAVF